MAICVDIIDLILSYLPEYELLPWISFDDINFSGLSRNTSPGAINMLEQFGSYDKNSKRCMHRWHLSRNKAAIRLFEKNIDFIKCYFAGICGNHGAGHIIKQVMENQKLRKEMKSLITTDLSANPSVIDVLEKYPRYIRWGALSSNPEARRLIEANRERIDWSELSANPAEWAIRLLEVNRGFIDWSSLSGNPSEGAIRLLETNRDFISWSRLSCNPSEGAIRILEANKEKIDWRSICINRSAGAMRLVEANLEKICAAGWGHLLINPFAIKILEANQDKLIKYWLSANPAIFYQVDKRAMRRILMEL